MPALANERNRVPLNRRALLMTPALLATSVAVETFADGQALALDERSVELAPAIVAMVLRAPFAIVLLIAAAATGITRMS